MSCFVYFDGDKTLIKMAFRDNLRRKMAETSIKN